MCSSDLSALTSSSPAVFGLLLVSADSYRVAWAAFAAIAMLVTLTAILGGPAIDRESARPG